MAQIPNTSKLTASTPQILNTIRANASTFYQDTVPYATNNSDNPKEIGAVIMQYTSLQNEFLNGLVNRIAYSVIKSKSYQNPWAFFKKGILAFGETIEEIFTNICEAESFNPDTAVNTVFKRRIPDVRTAFHYMNYQKFYPQTISDEQLRQAFLSWEGVTNLIASIVEAMYTAANYDEFLVMKYMIAKNIINGNIFSWSVPSPTAENASQIVSVARAISNKLEFMSSEYNAAGVKTHTPRNEQFIIVNADFDAIMSVEVLASAFNMSQAEFLGHRVLVDGFGILDTERLNNLLGDTPGYEEIGSDDLALLNNIPAVIVDKDWFMIYDNLLKFTEIYNSEGLYWNYSFHTWKSFGISPFANAVILNPQTSSVKNITVSPSATTVAKGQSAQFSANVTTEGFAPQDVEWSVNGKSDSTIISANGLLTVGSDETKTPLTVTAKSVFTPTVTGTASVTMS